MQIIATFTGENSLGYEKNKRYILQLGNYKGMSICRLDGTGYCPYQSLTSFLKNWDNIQVQSKN